jgi:hypothetical protein
MVVTRAMFAILAAAAFAQYADYGMLSIAAMIVFIIVAAFLRSVIHYSRIPLILMLIIAIALLCLITKSPYFALVLVLHWLLEKYRSGEPRYDIDDKGVRIISVWKDQTYSWDKLQNLVLKDGLLTIDFMDNRIVQYPVTTKDKDLDEKLFNQFCIRQLAGNK